MRAVTRNVLLGILAILVLLLALGAVPSYFKSGEPYYLTATKLNGSHPAVNVGELSERRYPYLTSALSEADSNGAHRSDPYWQGPFGIKESFTHSPFDEVSALRMRNRTAADDTAVYVTRNGTLYSVEVTQRP